MASPLGRSIRRCIKNIPFSKSTTIGKFIPFLGPAFHSRCTNQSLRDASKYRTPYSPWGGFTNGYEGDLRAHLLANQNDILRRASLKAMSPVASSGLGMAHGMTATTTTQQPGSWTHSHSTTTSLPAPILGTASHQYHPAIKAQYRNMAQQQLSKPKPTPASKPYKVGLPAAISLSLKSTKSAMQVPSKQSPVPLPANFLAAMTSSPGTPAPSSSKASPLQPSTPRAGSPNPNSTAPPLSSASSPRRPATPLQQQPSRISTTPVPLPRSSAPTQGDTAASSTPCLARAEPSKSSEAKEQPTDTPPKVTASINETPNSTNHNVIPGMETSSALATPTPSTNQQAGADRPQAAPHRSKTMTHHQPEGFPDVPGCESMEFVERMMVNLRKASQRRSVD